MCCKHVTAGGNQEEVFSFGLPQVTQLTKLENGYHKGYWISFCSILQTKWWVSSDVHATIYVVRNNSTGHTLNSTDKCWWPQKFRFGL